MLEAKIYCQRDRDPAVTVTDDGGGPAAAWTLQRELMPVRWPLTVIVNLSITNKDFNQSSEMCLKRIIIRFWETAHLSLP